jgi:hypothetical protein
MNVCDLLGSEFSRGRPPTRGPSSRSKRRRSKTASVGGSPFELPPNIDVEDTELLLSGPLEGGGGGGHENPRSLCFYLDT